MITLTAVYNGRLMTKTIGEWSKISGILPQTILARMQRNVPEEIILQPFIDCENKEISTDYEAWSELSPDQIEIMREFDQIGKIAKC
jgi:hypothetical protein